MNLFDSYTDGFGNADVSGNRDVSGNKNTTDVSGNKNTTDVSGNKNTTDVSGNSSIKSDIKDLYYSIFNKSNIILIIWFLAIYFILYFIVGLFFKGDGSSGTLILSRTLDFIILLFVLFFISSSYYSLSHEDKKNSVEDGANSFRNYLNDGTSIISLSIFILVFYIVIYLFRIPMESETKPMTVMVMETVAWFLFLILFIVDFFKYVLGISIVDYVAGTGKISLWDKLPEDVSGNKTDGSGNEVFSISNNLYTYDDAQAICSSYGAKLATYDQIEDAYNKGGEWCNYGWSANQMALFPTQKSTWQKLQGTETHKNDCGRPGVNGGYIANPNVTFGVNCYGKKPKASSSDLARMAYKTANSVNIQKSDGDVVLDAKVEYWKKNAGDMLVINPYNQNKWTAY